MRINSLPSVEYLREIFSYEPNTGLLRWKIARGGMEVGDIAGAERGNAGYLQVSIDRKLYRVHRIIWKIVTGEEPRRHLDHRNAVKADNRLANLREATKSQNQANVGLISSNVSGFKGVSRYRAGESYGKPWQAGIAKDGEHIHIGHFETAEEAAEAYRVKALELFGEFARVA